MKKKCKYLCLLLVSMVVGILFSRLPTAAANEALIIYDSTVEFRHFDLLVDENNLLTDYDEKNIITSKFNTKVIESAYLKVTLLPEYGGRILSILYKPTGHELLYQNPIGTPYGIDEGNFYYNWLMVYGGIFPTFPEPEHGKTWCLPWEARIVEQNEDKISVEMRFTDNITPVKGVPGQFDNGRTDITCISTVTVYKNKSYVDYNIQLINSRNEPVKYEYWTCITFAPGSEPDRTLCPPNTEIVVPIDQVLLRDNWWPWMGEAEKPTNQKEHLFEYKNLSHFKNWTDRGIAYANPSVEKEWWGVINHENEEGLLRIANNKYDTPGLKFWTWGIDSQNTDPNTFGDSSRPYIELWGGHSSEFFTDTLLKPNEIKVWDEHYIPTVGLSKITSANNHAAAYLNYSMDKSTNDLLFNAEVFTTHPGEKMKLNLSLAGSKEIALLNDSFVGDPKTAKKIVLPISIDAIKKGSYTYNLQLRTEADELLFEAEIPFESEYEGVVQTTAPATKSVPKGIWIPVLSIVIVLLLLVTLKMIRVSKAK